MKVLNTVKATRWRGMLLGLVLTGALAGSASAAVSELTVDRTAQLSPGRLHAALTGTIRCDPGTTSYLSGQIVQINNTTGYGSSTVVCDGSLQPYRIDVSAGSGTPRVFKAGKASANVSTFNCDPEFSCTSKFIDAVIRLTK
jgi:hypothetical protein